MHERQVLLILSVADAAFSLSTYLAILAGRAALLYAAHRAVEIYGVW